jgi:apolipoprotein N-acyltransferase
VVQGIAVDDETAALSAMAEANARLPGLPIPKLPVSRLLIAIVLIAACAHSAGVCWPFGFFFAQGQPIWWLQIMSLAVLCRALVRAGGARQAAALGLVFATAWLSSTFWWLYVSMHTYGGLHALLTVAAVVALAAALGLYYAIACAAFWHLSQKGLWMAAGVFAAAWTAAEMARGTWLTGFGWGAIGYAHVQGPLAAFVPWLGAYGVGALAAWLAAAVALGGWTKRSLWLAALAALMAGYGLPAGIWSQTAGTLRVSLLQGNIAQDEKFQPGTGVRDALLWYGEQLQRTTSALVVAPETAIPLLPEQLPDGYWQALQRQFSSGSQAAMIGIPLGSYTLGYTNSVIALSPGNTEPWQYDKHHLVPFGEFIPPLFKWFTALMNIPLGDFNRGPLGQPSFAWQGQRLAPNICYEDLFGEELGTRFVEPALAPTIFVNLSNIGWFGDSFAIDQHLAISRMRALEFERPFVRATNTGATAIVDYRGRVVAELPRLTRGVLEGAVEGRTGLTPFAWWVSRFGLWPLWLVVLAILALAWRRQRN